MTAYSHLHDCISEMTQQIKCYLFLHYLLDFPERFFTTTSMQHQTSLTHHDAFETHVQYFLIRIFSCIYSFKLFFHHHLM